MFSCANTCAEALIEELEYEYLLSSFLKMDGKHKTKVRALLGIVFLAILVGVAWFLLRPPKVKAVEVRRQKITPSIHGIGTVESKNIVIVASKISGRVVDITVDQGDDVTSKQILATLEDSEAQAEIERAEANLNRARSTAEVQRAAIQRSFSGTDVQRAALQRVKANTEIQNAAIRRAKSTVAAADASISKARAVQQQAQANADRWKKLFESGDASKMDTEERLTAAKAAGEELKSAIAIRNSALEEVKNIEAQTKATSEEIRQAEAQVKASNDDTATQNTSLKVIEQDISAAQAALDSARSRKDDTTIISQINGYVVSRDVEPGTVVNLGTPILKLADPTTLWATVFIDELFARSFDIGDSAEITLRSMQTNLLKGKVARIQRESDRVTEQVAVDITFDVIPEKIRLGEQLEAVITPLSRIANTIPASALINSKEGTGVWVVNDGRINFRKVKTGMADSNGETEVISGLEEGENVVIAPGALADLSNEGKRVSVIIEHTDSR